MKDRYLNVIHIQTSREILDWRDEHITNIEIELSSLFFELIKELKVPIEKSGAQNLFF